MKWQTCSVFLCWIMGGTRSNRASDLGSSSPRFFTYGLAMMAFALSRCPLLPIPSENQGGPDGGHQVHQDRWTYLQSELGG